MSNVNDIARLIQEGNFNYDDLSYLLDAVKVCREQLRHESICKFGIGDKVKFHNSRTRQDVFGAIMKINRKNIIVREEGEFRQWRVPAEMLQGV